MDIECRRGRQDPLPFGCGMSLAHQTHDQDLRESFLIALPETFLGFFFAAFRFVRVTFAIFCRLIREHFIRDMTLGAKHGSELFSNTSSAAWEACIAR
jgi:hypothetical protein